MVALLHPLGVLDALEYGARGRAAGAGAMTLRALLLRYRKDPRVIVTVPLLILTATSLIYYAVQKAKELSPEALSSQVLLFVLWNINILLIFGILFVLLRGVVKLVLERQRGIIGSRFRTKLAIAWMATSLILVLILFFFATDLLRTSIDVGASGKWIRAATCVGATPYVAVAGVFIPASMSHLMDDSIVQHKNFEQLNAQRPTLKASQTSLFLAVTLAILFGTLWTSIYASRRITIPIKALAEATGRLAEGGYGHRVAVAATDEVGRLIESFNDMSTQLDQQRQALTQANRYLSTVLDSVSAGILAFTDTFELLSVNHAALQMLQIEQPRSGANLGDVLTGDLTPLFDTLRELTVRGGRAREVTLIRGGELRYLEVSVARLSGGGDEGGGVAIEDSTSLVQAQKLAAWNEAARRIAHEIKNPLTPIQLSAERIARKFRNNDPDMARTVDEGTKTIVSEVAHLKRMVDEFARFARMPTRRSSSSHTFPRKAAAPASAWPSCTAS